MTVVALLVVGPSPVDGTEIDGRPLLAHTARRLMGGGADRVVLAVADGADPVPCRVRDDLGDAVTVVDVHGLDLLTACRAALDDARTVLVHDADRALVPEAMVRRVVDAVSVGASVVVPVLPVVDTVRLAAGDGRASGVVDRDGLRIVQTPIGLAVDVLRRLPTAGTGPFPDVAAAAFAAGHPVTTVGGDADASRISTAADLDRARRALTTTEVTRA